MPRKSSQRLLTGVRYPASAVMAKRGVRFVQGVVEDAGSIFQRIEQDNDLGIDAFVDVIRDGTPMNRQIAMQIKSGPSYYDSSNRTCCIPIGKHRQYWSAHHLPVYGVVYVPTLGNAYWIQLQHYLRRHPSATTVVFAASEANRFDASTFLGIFVPGLLSETPQLTFEQSAAMLTSSQDAEVFLGAFVMFRRFANELRAWEAMVTAFRHLPANRIPEPLVAYLAHIPWYSDLAYFGPGISPATRAEAAKLLADFNESDVRKLLTKIDRENRISRGSIGQAVEAIISSLPDVDVKLQRIIHSRDVDIFDRESAAVILAMHCGIGAAPQLSYLHKEGSEVAAHWLAYLQEEGGLYPYA